MITKPAGFKPAIIDLDASFRAVDKEVENAGEFLRIKRDNITGKRVLTDAEVNAYKMGVEHGMKRLLADLTDLGVIKYKE